jgi:hypothetical protein
MSGKRPGCERCLQAATQHELRFLSRSAVSVPLRVASLYLQLLCPCMGVKERYPLYNPSSVAALDAGSVAKHCTSQ